MRGLFVLLATASCIVISALASGYEPPLIYWRDDPELMEPTIMPEPVEGERWWFTPSRKAHHYSHKYQRRIDQMIKEAASGKVGEDIRLPNTLRPTLYNIRLLPFIEPGNFTTDGYIEIFFDCLTATRNISMNSAEITFDRLSVQVFDTATNGPIAISGFIDEQLTREIVTIQTVPLLAAGRQYKVTIKFTSILNDQLRGFYRSSYVENGVTKWLAVTQMEAPDARRAFPCWDEPHFKAEFSIILGRKTTMSSASNMNQIRSEPIEGLPGYEWDFYAKSVKMSSYLVAFLVSEFKDPLSNSGYRVPFRLWVRPEYVNRTAYSLKVAPLLQQFFEEYLLIPYPLPKQDLAAIPDFSAGAMENWGLVTYRETALLIAPTNAETQYQSVCSINAHELAHQWFGDLVTTDWWNTIWLNEGFASYMEFPSMAVVEPTWRMDEQYLTVDLHYALQLDDVETSRPMQLDVTTPAEISRMFDGISYEKGGCIIRMMNDFMSEPVFVRGLTRYLNNRAYANAVQDDLWQALQDQAVADNIQLPATVKQIMDTWTLQMGYPLIKVERNYAAGTAQVNQERFLERGNATDPRVYQWWVPLSYKTQQGQPQRSNWLSNTEKTKSISLVGAAQNEWVIFNVDQANFYRVAYDTANYKLIADSLLADHLRVPLKNRAQLLDDAFNLALANAVSYTTALDLTAYLKNEREYVPWRSVLTELDYIDVMLRQAPEFADWKIYMTSLIVPYYKTVGFEETLLDEHLTIYKRTDALNWACRLEIADCVNKALTKYRAFMNQPTNSQILSPNQRTVILRTGIEGGGQTEYDFAFNQYRTVADTAYLTAMTSSKQSSILSGLLEQMLDANVIRRADVNTLFNGIANNPVGNPIAFSFLINRWNDIQVALGTGYFINFYTYLRARLNTQQQLNDYIKLRDDHTDILGGSANVATSIDIVRQNVEWMNLHQKEIGQWLAATTATPTTTAPSSANAIRELNFASSMLLVILLGVLSRFMFP